MKNAKLEIIPIVNGQPDDDSKKIEKNIYYYFFK